MTDTAQKNPAERRRKPDFKFWTITSLVAAILGFNVAERLFLDVDEADISYARQLISTNQIATPSPGDVFVFVHDSDAFLESRFCSLQVFDEAEPVADKITASNLWGGSVNDTITAVGDYLGKKFTDFARVENAELEWQVSKVPRSEVRAPMQESCLVPVVEAVKNPNLTPFVVDAVYRVDSPDGQRQWVRFANPLMLDPSTCEGGCPDSKSLVDIVPSDLLTRLKAHFGFVRVR